jgi:hypothetical protein
MKKGVDRSAHTKEKPTDMEELSGESQDLLAQ